MSNPHYRPNESIEERLAQTIFLVEATQNEQHSLWFMFTSGGARYLAKKWKQISPSLGIEMGSLDNRPVFVQIDWAEIDGALIGFWEPTSEVVDYAQIKKWFEEHYKATYDDGTRPATCNSSNFHQCVNAIKQWKEKQVVIQHELPSTLPANLLPPTIPADKFYDPLKEIE